MDWKAKLLAGLRWARNIVVYYFNLVVDPPPAAIKWYVLAVLVIAVGGGIMLGPLFGGVKRVVSPAPITIPAADRFAMLPLATIPECSNAGEADELRTLLFDMTAIAKGKAERVVALEAEVAKLKAEAGKDVGTWRRKRKPVSTSAREDLRETLAR
jgi:hypothetical protein